MTGTDPSEADRVPLSDRDLDAFIATEVMGLESAILREIDPSRMVMLKDSVECWENRETGDYFPKHRFFPTQDLNACRDAEMRLTHEQMQDYMYHLAMIIHNFSRHSWELATATCFKLVVATARQRCEAMHACMEGGSND
jgi:hypothetical protein